MLQRFSVTRAKLYRFDCCCDEVGFSGRHVARGLITFSVNVMHEKTKWCLPKLYFVATAIRRCYRKVEEYSWWVDGYKDRWLWQCIDTEYSFWTFTFCTDSLTGSTQQVMDDIIYPKITSSAGPQDYSAAVDARHKLWPNGKIYYKISESIGE